MHGQKKKSLAEVVIVDERSNWKQALKATLVLSISCQVTISKIKELFT